MNRQIWHRLTIKDGRPWPPVVIDFRSLEDALGAKQRVLEGEDGDLYLPGGPGEMTIVSVTE